MRHLPTREEIRALADRARGRRFRVLMSGCVAGLGCGWEGTSYGEWSLHRWFADHASVVQIIPFCPEDFVLGTPRELCDIHGGNGFDVLDGKARVLTTSGKDWSEPMIRAARRMLEVAREHQVDLAILMDMSAACGSQVISDGDRTVKDRRYQAGPGVSAALLMKNGVPVISQRDFRTLGHLMEALDPGFGAPPMARDHHETDWYRSYFKLAAEE
jgi:uncharacterized protein YbbK (DUF523 family)